MALTPDWITADGPGVRLLVRVQPRASRTEVAGPHGDALRIRLTAPPVDGAANRELTAFIARRLKRPKSSVTVLRGETGRLKSLSIPEIDPAEVVAALWPG